MFGKLPNGHAMFIEDFGQWLSLELTRGYIRNQPNRKLMIRILKKNNNCDSFCPTLIVEYNILMVGY